MSLAPTQPGSNLTLALGLPADRPGQYHPPSGCAGGGPSPTLDNHQSGRASCGLAAPGQQRGWRGWDELLTKLAASNNPPCCRSPAHPRRRRRLSPIWRDGFGCLHMSAAHRRNKRGQAQAMQPTSPCQQKRSTIAKQKTVNLSFLVHLSFMVLPPVVNY